jgi:glycosyltransferase involved in cell wall biosynthesis
MKIAVYTIALNEEKHVERWYNSVKDADYILIADTGSTDRTVEIAKSLGINVFNISIKPWRFDTARNVALALLPDDIDLCISIDMDEVLSEDWRPELEKTTGNQITYVFRNNKDFVNNRIHARHGFIWKFLMHEGLVPDRTEMIDEFCPGIEVTHMPDMEKPRSQYTQLLIDALNENPDIGRYYKYITEALVAEKRFEEAEVYYLRVLEIPNFPNEDAARVYKILSEIIPEKTGEYLLLCLQTAPHRREPYYYIARWYAQHERWEECLSWLNKAFEIEKITVDVFKDNAAWGDQIQEMYEKANLLYNSNEQRIKK